MQELANEGFTYMGLQADERYHKYERGEQGMLLDPLEHQMFKIIRRYRIEPPIELQLPYGEII